MERMERKDEKESKYEIIKEVSSTFIKENFAF